MNLRYSCNRDQLLPQLRKRFVELSADAATLEYLESARSARHGRMRTLLHRTLRQFLSDFDVNGLLGMYAMHLLSTAHWQTLLGDEPIARWLDIGAGSGDVSRALRPLCNEVRTTELSRMMARRLQKQGIVCDRIDVGRVPPLGGPFDLISCLNVLDRCARPHTLLRHARAALVPRGRLVVALALPYTPFFYDGPYTPDPEQRLDCGGPTAASWESAVNQLVTRELEPLNMELEALSRAPYLSVGDTERSLYELDDVIAICRAR